jgi:hypothetical protein
VGGQACPSSARALPHRLGRIIAYVYPLIAMTQARATVQRNSFLIADDDDVRLEFVVCNESGP